MTRSQREAMGEPRAAATGADAAAAAAARVDANTTAAAAARADATGAPGAPAADPAAGGAVARAPRPARILGATALRRLAVLLVRFASLMLAVSFVTFALVSASPIDPVQANTGQVAYLTMSPERRAQLEARWGSDEPLLERYASWLSDAFHGDFGESLRFNEPVVEVVGERFASSVALMLTAWLISGAVGLALGVVAGVRAGGTIDRVVRGYCYLLSSTPAFWLGLVALMVFSVWLGWFPLGFSAPIGATGAVSLATRIHHLVLPALVLSLTGVANIALHTREKTREVMESPYVRFARARGERTGAIVRRHALRNLVLPAITLQCASISEIFGGSVLVEQVFSYPGLGQAAVTAGLGGDAALLVGIALASAALVFGGNLLANVLYGIIDPRLREEAAPHGTR